MAFNLDFVGRTAEGSSRRLNAYSYYYQNMYGSQQNNPFCFGDVPPSDVMGQNQGQSYNAYNYSMPQAQISEFPYYQYPPGQVQPVTGNTSGVSPLPKTINGRARSPVQRILRYRLDDGEQVFKNSQQSNTRYQSMRPKKRLLNDNRDQYAFTNANESANVISKPKPKVVPVKDAEERRRIELQLNEAMFFDRLFAVGFTASWYKLKKKDEDLTDLVCCVVEIIDRDNKIYKVYGGYTAPIRAQELAFGEAIKKLTSILEEQEKAKQLSTNATDSVPTATDSTQTPAVPNLLPNPLYNSSAFNMAANSQISGQHAYDQPVPPGTDNGYNEYSQPNDPYHPTSFQPQPPGTEKERFSETASRPPQRKMTDEPSVKVNQWQLQSSNCTTEKLNIDRPCLGRGEQETNFGKKAKDMGYMYRCIKLPSKKFYNIEYFGFEIEFGKMSDPTTRLKVEGSFGRDGGQARESAYAMAFDKLIKIEKRSETKTNGDGMQYECEWMIPMASSSKLFSSNQHTKKTLESPFGSDTLKKTIEVPNWDWDSTSDDLSILKCAPTFPMGRGKPRISAESTPGGAILDDRDWRWPAF